MSSLSDRYVHAVTRRLPAEERPQVGHELRAAIEERVRVRTGPDPAAVERDVLIEMGDPADRDRRRAQLFVIVGEAWARRS